MTWDKVCDYSLFQFDTIISGNYITDFSYGFTPWNTMTKLHERHIDVSDPIVENRLRITDDDEKPIDLTKYKIGTIRFKGYIFDLDVFIQMRINQLREEGATEDIDDDELVAMAKNQKSIIDLDLVPQVSTKELVTYGDFDKTVAIIDCGVKKNMITNYLSRGVSVALFPYDTDYQAILDYGVDGLMVSSGPGNPERLTSTIENVEKLVEKFPIFGICLGQQVIAKAFGATTYKMKFGHRGANQPVKDLKTGKVFITEQNHGFCINQDSLKGSDLELTQINLNDGTPEGFTHKELPLRTIQYHPEAGPGPTDTNVLFDEFVEAIKKY